MLTYVPTLVFEAGLIGRCVVHTVYPSDTRDRLHGISIEKLLGSVLLRRGQEVDITVAKSIMRAPILGV